MKLSKRLESMQFSPIRKLNQYADEARNKGIKVIGLNIGQPDIETPSVFFEAIRNFDAKVLAYTDSKGIPPLLDSFLKYYNNLGYNLDKDNILITNGGSEALLFTMISICDEGDEIIIPEPFYTNYNSFSDLASIKIVPFNTYAENGFRLPDKEVIKGKITSKTKAILISNPGNPTGVVYTKEELKMLIDLALEHDLYIISDEVYREFVYDNLLFTSALEFSEVKDRVIIIDSISKRYSACGARIGCMVSQNKDLIKTALKLGQSRLCSPTIEQIAAASLINTPKEYFDEVKKEYETRRNILFDCLKGVPGIICEKPTGAFYLIVKLPIKDSDHFAKWLLSEFSIDNKTVMIAPASGFYSTKGLGEDEVRLSYCVNQDDLKIAADILIKGLLKYKEIYK
ncbi:pyridoxal phosphate-dependent aminotransferase [Clostridium polynesiense]|uniref:pyridoxal phosphate-dependent aminotransferase n=1 Tax=Clostridium polynesiense TaxID=1325933 RepID=UPI00058AEE83|nr:pyridoxal phosphate-dependent aminotransferase [Clostridium polynesiense]